jgi:hypothetical protein
MFNLEESFERSLFYSIHSNFLIKILKYSLSFLSFLIILRNQVPEMKLLQLIPGFYLLLIIFCFIFLFFFSEMSFFSAINLEQKSEIGSKTLEKINIFVALKISYSLLFSCLAISINTIIPLSLDSLNTYSEQNLESLWSFDEVLLIETFLGILLIFFSQFPLILSFSLTIERHIYWLQKFWKFFSFLAFFISGILTPTIDGYTQLGFSFSTIFFYFLLINILEKRLSAKFSSILSLNF